MIIYFFFFNNFVLKLNPMNASKLKKRKAIDCKLIEESKSNPGYFKYMVTIQEIDGSISGDKNAINELITIFE